MDDTTLVELSGSGSDTPAVSPVKPTDPTTPNEKATESPIKPWPSIPESGSINAIIHANSRTRLYVRPIKWTSDQLEVLQCRFTLCNLVPGRRQKQDDEQIARELTTERYHERFHAATQFSWLGRASKRSAVYLLLDSYDMAALQYVRELKGQCHY
jgi:hypothetical protein